MGEWIRNISLFAIFSSLVLMLAPDSNYRHEIEIVTGLIMLILVINPVTVFLNGDYDNELRAIIANENSNIQDILQQNNTYVNQKDDMIIALAIKKYIYSELEIDCDVTVSGSYGMRGAESRTGEEIGEETEGGKIAGTNDLTQVYITVKERYSTSQELEDKNSENIGSESTTSEKSANKTYKVSDNEELIKKQIIKLVRSGFGINEENIGVKFEIK